VRAWLSSLVAGRALELALSLAIGYSAVTLAGALGDSATTALAQHIGRDPSGESGTVLGLLSLFSNGTYLLNFSIESTVVFYGPVLSATLAVGLIFLVGVFVVRRRDRELGACSSCASRIPHDSTHCAYCGSGVAPAER